MCRRHVRQHEYPERRFFGYFYRVVYVVTRLLLQAKRRDNTHTIARRPTKTCRPQTRRDWIGHAYTCVDSENIDGTTAAALSSVYKRTIIRAYVFNEPVRSDTTVVVIDGRLRFVFTRVYTYGEKITSRACIGENRFVNRRRVY